MKLCLFAQTNKEHDASEVQKPAKTGISHMTHLHSVWMPITLSSGRLFKSIFVHISTENIEEYLPLFRVHESYVVFCLM